MSLYALALGLWMGTGWLTGALPSGGSVEPTVSFNWIDLPTGKFLTTLVSTRTTYAMTPRMYVSALVQYSSATTSFSTNARFRWEYIPGSELFIVYNEGRDTFPVHRIELENRGFIVKINRLIRF